MTPERWQQITGIFNAALARNEAERSAFVVARCGDDADLRSEVEAMLAGHHAAGTFGDAPAFAASGMFTSASSVTRRALAPGSRVGAYEIVSLLGAGGMGEVYRARDPRLRREIAIKVISPSFATDPERLKRFKQEALAAAALNHPNIVAVYDVGGDDETPYLVTELVDGESLRRRLGGGPLPVAQAVAFGVQIAQGVAAAHEKGILHRDLKPENILVDRDGRLKIVDFGLAKLLEFEGTRREGETVTRRAATELGRVMGTVGYMAPEQACGDTVDQRADIFAIGAILFEMLGRRRAFQGTTTAEIVTVILRDDPPDLRTLNPLVPPALARLVAHSLEKQASRRFQNARDLAFALETIGGLQSGDLIAGAAPLSRRRWSIWHTASAISAAAALVAAGALGPMLIEPVERAATTIRTHRLTDSRGLEGVPAISPDGKSVAFVTYAGGKAQIFVRLVTRGTPLRLTQDTEADHLYPRWSPDSASIIYYRTPTAGESTGSIWEIPALGGGPRRIASGTGGADISHDGQRLVFPRFVDGRMQLATSNRDGADAKVVTDLEPGFYYLTPRWSLDDRKVAYVRGRANTFEIFVVSLDRGVSLQITNHGARLDGLAWAANGDDIVFSSSHGSTIWYLPAMNLWTVRADGSGLRQLTFGEASYTYPDTTSSGTVVVERVQRQYDIWRYPIDRSPIENVNAGTRLTHQTSAVHTPSAAPGDREVVYVSDTGSHANLWVMNLETRQSRQITYETDPIARVGLPLWSPDGKQIAYFMSRGMSWNYFLVRPDGSERRTVAHNAAWATWSPDGQWLYFSDYPEGTNLRKVRISGGAPEIVRSDNATRVAIAPDSPTLYYAIELPVITGGSDLEIRVARPENASSRVLARIAADRAGAGGGFQPVVSPDGKWLALALVDGITTNLWAMSTSTGQLRQLTDFGERPTIITRRVSWSADGQSIFAALGEAESDILLLEGLR
jgi:eukaryotic-like serine/threonine-protein kinase